MFQQPLELENIHLIVEQLGQKVSQDPTDFESRISLGLLALQASNLEIASQLLNEAYKLSPSNSRAMCSMALLEELQGRPENALSILRQASSKEPANLEVRKEIIRVLRTQKKFSEAIQMIEESIAFSSDDSELRVTLTEVFQELENKLDLVRHQNDTPILLVGLSHAAGGYVSSQLMKSLGFKYPLSPVEAGVHYNRCFLPSNLEKFLKHGGVLHTHMDASPVNLLDMKMAGVQKFIVLVRDPRQALYSTMIWYDEIRRRQTTPGISKYEYPQHLLFVGQDFHDWDYSKKLDFLIEKELPLTVKWIVDWQNALSEPHFDGKIVRFEDFKTEPTAFYRSIIAHYQIPEDQFNLVDIPCGLTAQGTPGAFGKRKGALAEWREHVTPKQLERINQLVPAEMLQSLGYDL